MISEEVSLTCVDDLLLETIDDVLKQVFGKNSAKVLLRHVKKSYSLNWEEIPKRAQVFSDALRKIIGSSGGVIIEGLILETLYSKLELEFKWKKGYGFSDYIKELRSKFGLTVEVSDRSADGQADAGPDRDHPLHGERVHEDTRLTGRS